MKDNIKYILSLIILLALFISVGNIVMAEKAEEIIEPVTINAEDIGIKEINENEIIKKEITEEDVYDETEHEDKIVDEDVSVNEEIEEDIDDSEEVTESPAPPEGKVEGYVAGVYFDPNTVDCEICGGECYTCHDGHTYAHCVSVDDEGYVFEEWCTVCGHGTETSISDEEFEALGVETNVEF